MLRWYPVPRGALGARSQMYPCDRRLQQLWDESWSQEVYGIVHTRVI